jgi:hypothetical protein
MWYKQSWLGDPLPTDQYQTEQPVSTETINPTGNSATSGQSTASPTTGQFTTDPRQLANMPVTMNVTPETVRKGQEFAKNGKAIFFNGEDGRTKLLIHGTANGYFWTGDTSVNSGDGISQNNGFVNREGLSAWVLTQGKGDVDIIACYGGLMTPIGGVKSLFKNKKPIGFYTRQSPEGYSQFVFVNS